MRRNCFYEQVVLLAVVLTCTGGCCQRNVCRLPAGCSWAFADCPLVNRIGPNSACGEPVACGSGVDVCVGEPCPVVQACRPARLCNVQAGPPPVTYKPPMPPKFLPVPTRPIFSPANPYAPTPARGAVEVGYGPQLALPGSD